MATTKIYPEPEIGGRGKKGKASETDGFSQTRLKVARFVLHHSPDLADSVLKGVKSQKETRLRLAQTPSTRSVVRTCYAWRLDRAQRVVGFTITMRVGVFGSRAASGSARPVDRIGGEREALTASSSVSVESETLEQGGIGHFGKGRGRRRGRRAGRTHDPTSVLIHGRPESSACATLPIRSERG